MSSPLRGSLRLLILASALGSFTVSAAPITFPTYDVTLTNWQLNLTTGQVTFSLTAPGISLTETGYTEDVPQSPIFGPGRYDYFNASFNVSHRNGGTSAQGTVNGITYNAANPLALYSAGGSAYFMIPTFPVPSGTNPLVTVPVNLASTPFGAQPDVIGTTCTPNCESPETIAFGFDFLPATGAVQLQIAGSDPSGAYTINSFNLTASPTPEPASYVSLAIGLVLLCAGARILPKRAQPK